MFLILPAATVMIGAFKGDQRRLHGRQRHLDRREVEPPGRILGEHPDQPHDGAPRRAARAPDRLRGDPQGHAGMDPLGVRDVLRRGGELRRHPARLRLHRHPGDDRDRHPVPQQRLRDRHLPARVRDLVAARRRAHLPVLPDPVDDPRDRARDRRPPRRVERGVLEPRRKPASSTGATSASRC